MISLTGAGSIVYLNKMELIYKKLQLNFSTANAKVLERWSQNFAKLGFPEFGLSPLEGHKVLINHRCLSVSLSNIILLHLSFYVSATWLSKYRSTNVVIKLQDLRSVLTTDVNFVHFNRPRDDGDTSRRFVDDRFCRQIFLKVFLVCVPYG